MFSSPEDLVRVTSHQSSNHASNKILNNHLPTTRSNGFTNNSGTNGVDDCSSTSRSITDSSTRRALMDSLQAYLPATIMLPPKRLLTLLNQAAEFQTERCLYHNKSISTNSVFDTAATSFNDIAMSSTGKEIFVENLYFLIAMLYHWSIISKLIKLFVSKGPISPHRACLMLATWLWITNVLSKIFPAIQFKFYQITAKKYGFANFLQMVVSYFDYITNILR